MTAPLALPRDPDEHDLRVADAMHHGLVRCTPDTSLRAVAALMHDERVHCVIVIEEPSDARSLWGVVFDLDLIAAATVRSLDDQKAGGTAMKPAVTITPDRQLARAVEQMAKHGVSHLVVVDPVDDRPLGVVSTLDVASALAAAWSPRPSLEDSYFPASDSRGSADSGVDLQPQTRGDAIKEAP